MKRRLARLKGEFVQVIQGDDTQWQAGRLAGVDEDSVELEFFNTHGAPIATVILPMDTIVAVVSNAPEFDDLKGIVSEREENVSNLKKCLNVK